MVLGMVGGGGDVSAEQKSEGRAEVSRVQAENAFWAEGPARAKGLRQEACSRVLVSWGCCRRRAQTGRSAQQELARSRFGRPEVRSGCGAWVVPLETRWEGLLQAPLPASPAADRPGLSWPPLLESRGCLVPVSLGLGPPSAFLS